MKKELIITGLLAAVFCVGLMAFASAENPAPTKTMPETMPEIKAVRKTLRFIGEEPYV